MSVSESYFSDFHADLDTSVPSCARQHKGRQSVVGRFKSEEMSTGFCGKEYFLRYEGRLHIADQLDVAECSQRTP